MKNESITLELVSAETLLRKLWPDPRDRPSLRTLRNWQKERIIPSVRLGGRVYFNIEDVAQSIRQRWTVKAKAGTG
jgi:hypothetical protein